MWQIPWLQLYTGGWHCLGTTCLIHFKYLEGNGRENEKECCFIFHCQYFGKEKDGMDPFTDSKQDIYSWIFMLELEKWGGKNIYIYTYMLVSSPFKHHVSCHLFTDGYLRQGPWIYNDLVVHADQILTDPPWLAGFINYHSNFLFCHTFLSLFPCIKCKFVLAQFMQCAQMLSDKSSNNLIK